MLHEGNIARLGSQLGCRTGPVGTESKQTTPNQENERLSGTAMQWPCGMFCN
jgi:hypothetical protein